MDKVDPPAVGRLAESQHQYRVRILRLPLAGPPCLDNQLPRYQEEGAAFAGAPVTAEGFFESRNVPYSPSGEARSV